MYDVIVIGAGVIGCCIARELSRFACRIAVVEREEDVCSGTSKANSGIVHGGYDARPGSWKAKLNVEGAAMMPGLSRELDFSYRRNGSVVVCFDQEGIEKLEELKRQGIENGVKGLEILTGEDCRRLEPHLSEQVAALLHVPSGGIVCPFELTIAMGENAAANGAEFFFEREVTGIRPSENGYEVETTAGTMRTRAVVNAAGVYADVFHNMVSSHKIRITPRRGQYCLMDKQAGDYVDRTVFQLPTRYGKGVLVTPTVHGNLMVGPTAEDIEEKEGSCTTREGLSEVLEKAALSVESVPQRMIITSFAGLRAHGDQGDFVIGEPEDAPFFFDAACMESPGLSASPAVGVHIAALAGERLGLEQKTDFKPERKGIRRFADMSPEEKQEAVRRNPAYGNVICRCETVTEAEIVDAVRRPLGARSLDGIKRRTRSSMGRCQGGFCTPKVTEILMRELGLDYEEITKAGPGSEIVSHRTKEAE